jgi:hypothetical protein
LKRKDLTVIALVLIGASVILYSINYLIFHDIEHIFIFLLSDLAFSFIEVIIVGLIIDRFLASREKRSVLYKLNMISGIFFSEIGTKLLGLLLDLFDNRSEICPCLDIGEHWSHSDFVKARNELSKSKIKQKHNNIDLQNLKNYLNQHKSLLLEIITNPNVLEHDEGVELLWAVFHLSDELNALETGNKGIQGTDEIVMDEAVRVYQMLSIEWLNYMEFSQNKYPLFYKAVLSTNQFRIAK